MTGRSEYMREWRKDNKAARDRQTRAARARANALRQLAKSFPREFKSILDQCRKKEGLPPL